MSNPRTPVQPGSPVLPDQEPRSRPLAGFLWAVVCLAAVLGLLFFRSFEPGRTLFSNDGPLGTVMAQANHIPTNFLGVWQDLNWVGIATVSLLPQITDALYWVCGPILFSKFYAPFSLLFLGLAAWGFFRQLGFARWICILGGLAAALNMDGFSYACWGLPAVTLVPGAIFLALAALHSAGNGRRRFLKIALAGMAVGMGVMEGFDVGAIFSLYVAAFTVFLCWIQPGTGSQRILRGVGRLALVAGFAAFLAAQALSTLISTQIKGVVGMKQDTRTKEERWNEATQWSLPKAETLGVIMPGLFGYRMLGYQADTARGSAYWGAVGQDPRVTKLLDRMNNPDEQVAAQARQTLRAAERSGALMRHSGSGEYAGLLVVLLAAFALLQSLRKGECPFSLFERRCIWFWSGAVFVSLLLAYGRHAPFYRLAYALPYFSTIRNPIKFLHPLSLGLVILFGYGLAALNRKYLAGSVGSQTAREAGGGRLRRWWKGAPLFDRRWALGLGVAMAAGLVGWLIYASSRQDLIAYLQLVGFEGPTAAAIAAFSLKEVGWFVLFLAVSAAAVLAVMSGVFAGPRAKWAGVVLGLVLVADLCRANAPWIVYYNYHRAYASNPVVDFLRDHAYQKRVTAPFFINQADHRVAPLYQLYRMEWVQHLFQYYDVQSLDIIQMPREKQDYNQFMNGTFALTNLASLPRQGRLWQLTSTRYLLGLAGYLDWLNKTFDPVRRRFRIQTRFALTQSGDGEIQVVVKTNGPYALIEDGAALPRASLYSHWRVSTNDAATLKQLADPAFHPAQTVLVAGSLPAAGATNSVTQPAGTVAFTHYEPKVVRFSANVERPAVLLLNDHYDPDWKVRVDGHAEQVLRCNYLMRGVYLRPGRHTVEFRYQPSTFTFCVSLAAVVLGLVFCGVLAFGPKAAEAAVTSSAAPNPNGAIPTK